MKLRSVAAEAKACRAAWAAMPDATAGVHIHHEVVVESLTEPIEARIEYILTEKPKDERALRLRLMRPVEAAARAERQRVMAQAWAEYERRVTAWAEHERVRDAAWGEYERVMAQAWAEYERVMAQAHAAICPTPDCPWDGSSIFGGAS